jgi:hypothetical protein
MSRRYDDGVRIFGIPNPRIRRKIRQHAVGPFS